MKVAINALSVTPGMTGIGAYAQDLIEGSLQYKKNHRYVYITHPRLELPTPEEVAGYRQIVIDVPNVFCEQLQLPLQLKQMGVDYYHSPLFTCPIIDEIPSIITLHDVIPLRHREFCTEPFLRFFEQRLPQALRAQAKIVTTSKFSKREIVACLGVAAEEITVIYQAVGECFFTSRSVAKLPGLPKRYVLYVGMLEERKNIAGLLRAFALFAKEYPEFELVVVGRKNSPEFDLQEIQQGLSLQGRVREMGYVSREELLSLYRHAAMFVFPSLYEGFGRPVVEAMAAGAPVITSEGGALAEVTGDAAVLVDPRDDKALAEAMGRVAGDVQLRESLIARGKERASHFTQEQFTARVESFYSQLEKQL